MAPDTSPSLVKTVFGRHRPCPTTARLPRRDPGDARRTAAGMAPALQVGSPPARWRSRLIATPTAVTWSPCRSPPTPTNTSVRRSTGQPRRWQATTPARDDPMTTTITPSSDAAAQTDRDRRQDPSPAHRPAPGRQPADTAARDRATTGPSGRAAGRRDRRPPDPPPRTPDERSHFPHIKTLARFDFDVAPKGACSRRIRTRGLG